MMSIETCRYSTIDLEAIADEMEPNGDAADAAAVVRDGEITYGHAQDGGLLFSLSTHFCGLSKNGLDKFAEEGLRGDVMYECKEFGSGEDDNKMEVFKRRERDGILTGSELAIS
jgi:hypothetical protein